MNATKLGSRMKAVFDRFRFAKPILLVVSIVVLVALLYLGVGEPLMLGLNRANIPDFPDCAGQPAPVVEYLKSVYNQTLDQPASDEAVGRLGMAYHAQLFYNEAAACYKRAEVLNPDEWRWRYYASLLHEELGDTRATIDGLKFVVERQPALSQAWFRLGNSYMKTRSFQEADRAFRQVLQLPEDTALVMSGISLPASGAFPLKVYAQYQLARMQFQEKRFADARKLLEEVVAANPTFGPAYRLLADVYRELLDEEKAARYETRAGDFDAYVPPADVLYNALVLCSRNTDFLSRQINTAVKWQNYEWAVALINHILKYSPHDGEALTFRIKLTLDTQNLNDLGPLLMEYAEQFKSDETKLLDMAKYLRLRGEYEASVALLKQIITVNPKAIEAHVEFVRMLQTFKQYDLGIQYCTEVVKTEPENSQIRLELVDLLIHKGRLDQAGEQLNLAQRLNPDDETRSIMMGRISEKRGDAPAAIRHFQHAAASNPRNNTTQLELGKYLQDLHRWGEAAKQCQQALQASPNNIDFIEQFALLLAACPDARIRDGERALELSKRLILVKKQTVEQDIRCGIALSAAYAETGQFADALSTARKNLERSRTFRNTEYTGQLQKLVNLFESQKPYRFKNH